MGGKSGGGDTTTVQQADPWSGQQPYLLSGFGRANDQYLSGGPQFYPGRTYVPFSGQSEQALGMAQNRAMGSPLESGLNDYLGYSMGGGFLNANPYINSMYGNAANRMTEKWNEAVMPGINATFGGAGRTGSGIHGQTLANSAGELGDSLSMLASNLYGENYARERGAQQAAAAMVPMASGIDWQNIGQMGGVGRAVEGKAGEVLGDSMNRFNYYQNLPEQNLARYIAAIQGNYGGAQTTNTNTENNSNPMAGALGGGMLGFGLGKSLPAIGSALGIPMGAGAWPLAIAGALYGGLSS